MLSMIALCSCQLQGSYRRSQARDLGGSPNICCMSSLSEAEERGALEAKSTEIQRYLYIVFRNFEKQITSYSPRTLYTTHETSEHKLSASMWSPRLPTPKAAAKTPENSRSLLAHARRQRCWSITINGALTSSYRRCAAIWHARAASSDSRRGKRRLFSTVMPPTLPTTPDPRRKRVRNSPDRVQYDTRKQNRHQQQYHRHHPLHAPSMNKQV